MDIEAIAVTAAEMSAIESRIFAAGMPVAALMEKAGILLANRMQQLHCHRRVGVLVGTGHNGGDALVVARELHFRGYQVLLHQPIDRAKELTAAHARYAASLGIPQVELADLLNCDWIIDGLFGFGLTRSIEGNLAELIAQINSSGKAIVSIDLPSGLHTDTGEVMGTAIRATHSLCLGLWKRAYLHDRTLPYTGQAERIDFGISIAEIQAVLGTLPQLQRVTPTIALVPLGAARSPLSHKYRQGHLLLVCGSRQYGGAAILAGLAASASGVGMLSIAVPNTLKPILTARLPEALIVGCAETESGAIAQLPIDLSKYNAIACGPGLTSDATAIVEQIVQSDRPLVLDADGLNIIAERLDLLRDRSASTLLTPHPGEFKRLFPTIAVDDRLMAVWQAAQQCGATVLLKGARVAIAHQDQMWVNPASTPALARGGSGDVLTGLAGGLLAEAVAANQPNPIAQIAVSATWWHAQAAIATAQERSDRGVDPVTLSQALIPTLRRWLSTDPA
ncbi:NAD(P)H-hydrate dehydratase [Microcoleus sp. FACHB-1515]|uniref:NAD(P)H-hydrate dehydratase n=1 Tax=Cyanophyceae TaxID=3028117 RepID=UPI0016853E38|nr:NAD(P)H-hydrate dehydratase [Microcoleus sp. FACHB-1515]